MAQEDVILQPETLTLEPFKHLEEVINHKQENDK